ncbi:hypothetical protein E5R92_07265 [Candidatus Pelagibacter giovannonii]|uniref:Large polyvalent protein associated domain-containing protein n=1 Tax=Candidatus Pelagibacter giovannonii TaxID=2563896 RepID=A0A6H1Q657_9PROT|nr:hypothetical protein [Candidatus Pelagibacter giovannonii]QIZ21579.1 hypothetical protein E5R92_07265 [Candidatus Pelagibacter giovannonii]
MEKKIEQPTEQYEEFDYLSDFYFPLKEVEDKYSSPILKRLRENEIDPHEFLGIEKVEGTGVVKRIEDKADLEEGKKTFGQSFIDFIKDAPEAAAVSTAEAGVNLSNNLVQLFGAGTNMVFKGSEKGDGISQATTEFAQGYNKSSEEIISKLTQYTEDNDVNGVSQLMTDIGIDIAATIPIQRMLKKTGVPSYVATPLSFGLVYGMTGGDKEAENNMFIDSETIHGLNELLGVLPDTPESEIAELVATTFEGTAWGALGDRLVKVFKVVKNNVPAYMNPQTSISMGGAAATGEGAIKVQENAQDNLNVENQNLDEEKKTLNFDEDNQISSPMPGDDEMASAGLGAVFKSILKETAKKLPAKGNGEQFLGQLKNTPGLKQQELKWSGLDDFLKGKKNVTKEEVKDYLEKNTLDVSEVAFPRVSKDADNFNELLNKVKTEKNNLLQEIQNLPQNKNILIDSYNYKLTIVSGKNKTEEMVSMKTLEDVFIGQRLNTYIAPPALQTRTGKVFNKQGLIDDFGKKGDPNTLEFYMFEDSVSGRMTAVRKIDVKDYTNKEDPFSGGKYKFTYKDEMDIKEAEKYMLQKSEDKINRALKAVSGTTKFGGPGYVEPGGKDYKELVFKLKGDGNYPIEKLRYGTGLGNKAITRKEKTEFPYRSPAVHFGTKNEFAHVRFKTRMLNGKKVLSVEEMQSDIVQDMGRNFGEKVTDFPFKNNWYELVSKRLIRYAADNGFDSVAIPKGSTIASRYKQKIDNVVKVNVQPKLTEAGTDPHFVVTYFGAGNRQITRKSFYSEELNKLEKEIGTKNYSQLKDNIDNFVKNRPTEDLKNTRYFADFDKPLILGTGKGKTDLYDKAIPSFLKKYSKKWNAKVYEEELDLGLAYGSEGTGKIPVTIIQLTDDMKKSVQQDGQALFEIFGIGSATAVGANAVSDSMKNNTISQKTN